MRQWTSVNIYTAFTLCVCALTYNIKYYNQDLCINNNSSYLGWPSHFQDSDIKHLPKTYIYCYVNYLLISILQTKWFKDKRFFFFFFAKVWKTVKVKTSIKSGSLDFIVVAINYCIFVYGMEIYCYSSFCSGILMRESCLKISGKLKPLEVR